MKTQPLGDPKPNPGNPRYDVTRSDFKAPAGGALDPASPGWKPPAPSSTPTQSQTAQANTKGPDETAKPPLASPEDSPATPGTPEGANEASAENPPTEPQAKPASAIDGTEPSSDATILSTAKAKKNRIPMPAIVASMAGALLLLVAIIYFSGIAALESKLTANDWTRYEDLELTLSFDGETIEYSADMGYFYTYDYPIAYMDYKVTGPGTIKVDYGNGGWQTRKVKIEDGILTFTPALTSTDSIEFWFN